MTTAKQIIDKALSYLGTYDGGNSHVNQSLMKYLEYKYKSEG